MQNIVGAHWESHLEIIKLWCCCSRFVVFTVRMSKLPHCQCWGVTCSTATHYCNHVTFIFTSVTVPKFSNHFTVTDETVTLALALHNFLNYLHKVRMEEITGWAQSPDLGWYPWNSTRRGVCPWRGSSVCVVLCWLWEQTSCETPPLRYNHCCDKLY